MAIVPVGMWDRGFAAASARRGRARDVTPAGDRPAPRLPAPRPGAGTARDLRQRRPESSLATSRYPLLGRAEVVARPSRSDTGVRHAAPQVHGTACGCARLAACSAALAAPARRMWPARSASGSVAAVGLLVGRVDDAQLGCVLRPDRGQCVVDDLARRAQSGPERSVSSRPGPRPVPPAAGRVVWTEPSRATSPLVSSKHQEVDFEGTSMQRSTTSRGLRRARRRRRREIRDHRKEDSAPAGLARAARSETPLSASAKVTGEIRGADIDEVIALLRRAGLPRLGWDQRTLRETAMVVAVPHAGAKI